MVELDVNIKYQNKCTIRDINAKYMISFTKSQGSRNKQNAQIRELTEKNEEAKYPMDHKRNKKRIFCCNNF